MSIPGEFSGVVSAASAPAIELRGITWRCAQTIANDNVSLKVAQGEIHGIAGENGAGKSTLMRILYGMYRPDEGEIRVQGKQVSFRSPADAIAQGIGMVHQHFMLIPAFTVAENIILGHEPRKGAGGFRLDRRVAAAEIRTLTERYSLAADPDALAGDLSVGEQQRVEILKLLYRKARILIFDEPTAVLSPGETKKLFEVLRELRGRGMTILLITHKLDEIREITDRVTVLRRGKVVGQCATRDTNARELARMMVGRDVALAPERVEARADAAVALRVAGLSLQRKSGMPALDNVSFSLRRGEVLGIAGIDGNGQTELAEVLAGVQVPGAGTVELEGRPVDPKRWRGLRDAIAWVPDDRHKRAVVSPFSLMENMLLGFHWRAPFSRGGFLRRRALAAWTREKIAEFDIRPTDPGAALRGFSGGNQQKAVLARELAREGTVLIAAHPTRGVDVGAIEFIHRRIIEQKQRGRAILLISSELEELLALSDRIGVMHKGRLLAILNAKSATVGEIGHLMTGGGVAAGSESR